MAAALAWPCSRPPTSRPVYTPSAVSATVPSAPVSPSRRARMLASSTGVAVTSQTRWPACRCSLGQLPGAFPDPVGHRVVVDLLAERDDVVHPVAGDERQRRLAGGVDMVGVLGAPQPEGELAPGQPDQVRAGRTSCAPRDRGRSGRSRRRASACCRHRRTRPRPDLAPAARLTAAAAAEASPAMISRLPVLAQPGKAPDLPVGAGSAAQAGLAAHNAEPTGGAGQAAAEAAGRHATAIWRGTQRLPGSHRAASRLEQ